MAIETHAWNCILFEFPAIRNCCIDVRRLLGRRWDEETAGTGFEKRVRDRIKTNASWATIWEVSSVILREFGLLVVLCNHGKHRSLSVAFELAEHFGCKMVCTRHATPQGGYRRTHDIMTDLRPLCTSHCWRFGHRMNPVINANRCICGFDGIAWAKEESEPYRSCHYLTIAKDDIVVRIRCDPHIAEGWALGCNMGANGIVGWFPPDYVRPFDAGIIRQGPKALLLEHHAPSHRPAAALNNLPRFREAVNPMVFS